MSFRGTAAALVALLAGIPAAGCEEGGDEPNDAPPNEQSSADRDRPDDSPPRVPGATDPSDDQGDRARPRDLQRNCARRAAGIAGWVRYLEEWSTAGRTSDLPTVESDLPAGDEPALVVTPTRVAVAGEELTTREAEPDAGAPNWTDSRLENLVDKIGARAGEIARIDADGYLRVRVAAHPSVRAATVERLLEGLPERRSGARGGGDAGRSFEIEFAVRDPSRTPPVERPRPGVPWVEEMIATFERTDHPDTRHQLLDDAIRRAAGPCRQLHPLFDRIYTKDPRLADRRSEEPWTERSLIEEAADCPCDEIDWRALEGLAVWSLQPLGPARGAVRLPLRELRDAPDRTIGDLVRETD